jgi:alpha-beta hydrolase superfamily lysophospholipase
LFNRGFDVFRLNLRDHGPSHHLNTGLFYAVLLDEVFEAVRQISESRTPETGVSCRILPGRQLCPCVSHDQCVTHPINGLKQVIGISPVLDPDKATDRIDDSRLILKYFLKKWRRSLAVKQHLYPDRYDFSSI